MQVLGSVHRLSKPLSQGKPHSAPRGRSYSFHLTVRRGRLTQAQQLLQGHTEAVFQLTRSDREARPSNLSLARLPPSQLLWDPRASAVSQVLKHQFQIPGMGGGGSSGCHAHVTYRCAVGHTLVCRLCYLCVDSQASVVDQQEHRNPNLSPSA